MMQTAAHDAIPWKLIRGGDSDIFALSHRGKRYALKHYLAATPAEIAFETKILEALGRHRLPIPRPVYINPEARLLCYTFIPGSAVQSTPVTTRLCREIGMLAGALDAKSHAIHLAVPASKRNSIWNLTNFHRHQPFLRYLPPRMATIQKSLQTLFAEARAERTLLQQVPQSIIHNDVSETNVLVRGGRLAGLVDFSDATLAPRICNLAIACAHFCFDDARWREKLHSLSSAYRKHMRLDTREVSLLPMLVRMRLASLILGNLYQAKRNHEATRLRYHAVISRNAHRFAAISSISNGEILAALSRT